VLTQLLRLVVDDTLAAVPGTKQVFPNEIQDNWAFRLSLNLLGYATIFAPGYMIFQYVKKSNYLDRAGRLRSLETACQYRGVMDQHFEYLLSTCQCWLWNGIGICERIG